MITHAKIIEACHTGTSERGIRVEWCDDEKGFGQIDIVEDGSSSQCHIDSENMSKEFVKRVLSVIVDNAIFVNL